MIDKTVLELVDRLVSTTARLTKAEQKAAELNVVNIGLHQNLADAEGKIKDLEEEVETLKATIKEKDSVISFWYERATKFEEEQKKLKEPKNDTNGN